MPQNVLPEDFQLTIRNLDYNSVSIFGLLRKKVTPHKEVKLRIIVVTVVYMWQGTTKINLAVDRLPQFKCCNPCGSEAGPEHMGTIHIGAERYGI